MLNDDSLLPSNTKNSTIYAPYDTSNDNSLSYLGYGLDFNLINKIPESSDIEGYPGLYSETNPLGYYTYRIVVKQQDQDYYNVYAPGAIAGSINWSTPATPSSSTTLTPYSSTDRLNSLPSFSNRNSISNISLLGDNINKVPRDLREVNSNDTEFSSSTVLFNRVNPIYNVSSSYSVQQLNITGSGQNVISIKAFKDMGRWATTKGSVYPGQVLDTTSGSGTLIPNPWYPYFTTGTIGPPPGNDLKFNFHDIFFKSSENPFIATLETNFSIGSTPDYGSKAEIERAFTDLSVFETRPTLSNIDIYWESSSSGLITDLNSELSFTYYPIGFRDSAGNDTSTGGSLQYIQNENMSLNTDATLNFQLVNQNSNIISSDSVIDISSVVDGNGANRTSEFKINKVNINTFTIQNNALFTFLANSNIVESYTFNLLVSDNSGSSYFTNVPLVITNCTLQNSAPNWLISLPAFTIVNLPTFPPIITGNRVDKEVFRFDVANLTNGSANTTRNSEELNLTVESAASGTDASLFYINKISSTEWALYVDYLASNGTYSLKLKATDANGTGLSTDSNNFEVIIS